MERQRQHEGAATDRADDRAVTATFHHAAPSPFSFPPCFIHSHSHIHSFNFNEDTSGQVNVQAKIGSVVCQRPDISVESVEFPWKNHGKRNMDGLDGLGAGWTWLQKPSKSCFYKCIIHIPPGAAKVRERKRAERARCDVKNKKSVVGEAWSRRHAQCWMLFPWKRWIFHIFHGCKPSKAMETYRKHFLYLARPLPCCIHVNVVQNEARERVPACNCYVMYRGCDVSVEYMEYVGGMVWRWGRGWAEDVVGDISATATNTTKAANTTSVTLNVFITKNFIKTCVFMSYSHGEQSPHDTKKVTTHDTKTRKRKKAKRCRA